MLNMLWLILILISVVCAAITGHTEQLAASVIESAKTAFSMALGLGGIMAFWLGIMKIAEDSGLIKILAQAIYPLMHKLFPTIPKDHPAWGSILLNISANMLGLANAATPFGLKAMQELNKLNKNPGVATNAMCMFTAINTSSVQLIPSSGIAFLAAGGASEPYDILITALLATIISSAIGITAAMFYQKKHPGK